MRRYLKDEDRGHVREGDGIKCKGRGLSVVDDILLLVRPRNKPEDVERCVGDLLGKRGGYKTGRRQNPCRHKSSRNYVDTGDVRVGATINPVRIVITLEI